MSKNLIAPYFLIHTSLTPTQHIFCRLLSKFRDVFEANVEGQTLRVSKTFLGAGASINQTIYGPIYSLLKSTVSI